MRIPRLGTSKFVSNWLLVTLVASIVAMLDRGAISQWTALAPERVWRGEIWRVVTWAVIETGPLQLVFTLAAIYKFGGELAPRWGDRRLQRFMTEIVFAAAVVTVMCSLVSQGAWYMHRFGGWAVTDAIIIAWARQYPTSTVRFYGFLDLNGQKIVWFTVGITTIVAIAYGPFVMMPELVAAYGAALYPRVLLER